jgi:GNAT superfamily N-acetyltransferase
MASVVYDGRSYSHRPLDEAEASILHEELKTTPNILGYSVRELVSFRDVLVADVDAQFAGACVSKDLLFGWTDIAILYVLPAFRGRGLGRGLYTAAWQRARERGRHILTLSRSPEVVHLMEQSGMEISRGFWKAPLAAHLHMNRHMANWYRLREAGRKSRQMKFEHPLVIGTSRSEK